ncbi:LacI family DNA-binding transcriptional regulator [Novosphingobium aerophilum]|uniref:LacI family DNA-binding transcriptional regulator n=1 Tax=Novosphingobium aerophilum TaxID=2839843 RepID=A0A7X1F825_9SPHN|nr:LacI family DNA-binding transcriptional regulator [Novosphingobium aerophilum]MBC2652118.1 LacI family DNA-binding transcriptional regulator [Novosphingobium aerophilum]
MSGEIDAKPRRIRNISELAKLAGVSAGTVSRALAGKDLVNSQTRERIQALAREHGFRPNQMASRLRTGQTGVIGVVIPLGHEKKQHISDPFFMTMLGHLADGLTEVGYDLMLSRVIPSDGDDWLERIVDSGMLDGVVMIGQSDQFDTIERTAEVYRPLVVWGTRRSGQRHCVVGTDSFVGGELAVRHLLARGRRKLAFFGDTKGLEIEQRLAGSRSAIAQSGTGATLDIYPTHLSQQEMSEQIAADLDAMDPAIDGIFAASDVIAMGTLRLLHERGRKVPEDVAIVGFDDLPLATQTVPQLTTVRQDIAGGARTLVTSLLKRIAGDEVPSTVMTPTLVVRESA